MSFPYIYSFYLLHLYQPVYCLAGKLLTMVPKPEIQSQYHIWYPYPIGHVLMGWKIDKYSRATNTPFISASCLFAWHMVNCHADVYSGSLVQDSLDQCPMPINADQTSGIDPNVDQFWSMKINADKFRSIPINADQSALRGIDRNWSALIGNDQHWEAFRINAMILIGIDRHWALIGGVLLVTNVNNSIFPGGQLGLWVGISMVTLFELLALISNIFQYIFLMICKQKKNAPDKTIRSNGSACLYSAAL